MAARRPSGKASADAPGLRDATVLLCAHGRGDSGGEAAPDGVPEAHAAALRARGCFARVEACVLRGAPSLAGRLADAGEGRVFVVPLLMAEGHTSRVLLPEALAQAGAAGRRATLCRPVGVSPALGPLVAGEAMALCRARGWNAAETSLVIAGHGTTRHEGSGASADFLARSLAAAGRFARVAAAFLEQEPFVEDALSRAAPGPCVVVGFFMDHGGHSAGDIPRLIAAAHPDAAYTGAIGARPAFAEIILDAVREAAAA
jgi:sirohydrochlorin cobaltochelatase